MADLPRITVIICCHNHAEVVERALQSALDQNYPDLELIVIDADSSDGSKEIIEKFSDRLTWWSSRRVTGEAHAINIGLDRATGDLIAFLPGDGWYLPDALHQMGGYFRDHPETDFLYGRCRIADDRGEGERQHFANIYTLEDLLDVWNVWRKGRNFQQSECFWTRRIYLKVRSFRENFMYSYAYEYWTRLFQAGAKVARIEADICGVRHSPAQSEEVRGLIREEELQIVKPLLWDPKVQLDPNIRRRLQADWLFETHFLPAWRASIDAGEPKWQRHLMQSKIIAKHPKILLSEQFRERLKSSAPHADTAEGYHQSET